MESENIFEILEENQNYKSCNIEFEPFGGAYNGVNFQPVLEMQNENIELRKQLEILKSFIGGEWIETEIICQILGIEFGKGLSMFDFSRTAEWNPAPLNGQKITTKFRPKEIELRERLYESENTLKNLVEYKVEQEHLIETFRCRLRRLKQECTGRLNFYERSTLAHKDKNIATMKWVLQKIDEITAGLVEDNEYDFG